MSEFQQIAEGGVGAVVFYLLYTLINMIKSLVAGGNKPEKTTCMEHGAMCTHLESIRSDVAEIKGNIDQLLRDVGRLEGRLDV